MHGHLLISTSQQHFYSILSEAYEDLAVGVASGQISKEAATWFLEHGKFQK